VRSSSVIDWSSQLGASCARWLSEVHPDIEVRVVEIRSIRMTQGVGGADRSLARLCPERCSRRGLRRRVLQIPCCAHVCVDLDRRRVRARDDESCRSFAHWQFLEPSVRAISSSGSASWEPSQAARPRWSAWKPLRDGWVPNTAEYADDKMRGEATPWRSEEFVHIASAQSLVRMRRLGRRTSC